MSSLHTPDQFKTKPARISAGVIGLILAYLLGSRGLDTGSWWQYLGTFLLLALSIRLIMKAFKNVKT